MIPYNNSIIVPVDTGYGNIKNSLHSFPTGIAAYKTKPAFEGKILHINNMYYRIGEGHKEYIPDKTVDEEFRLLTIAAICDECRSCGYYEGNIFLAVGCPTTMVTVQRESTREYFLKEPHIDCEYNNIHYHLTIVGCFVYPQGYAAVTEYLHNMTGVNMVVDIGNGTANILQVNNKRVVEEKCVTEKLGVNQYMIAVQKAVMAAYGKKIDPEVVELFIRTGDTDAPDNYKNIFLEETEKYCRKIFDALYRCEYDPDFMKLYVCGGGVHFIRRFGKYNSDRVIFIDDICATAKGYQQFALKSLKALEKRSE